LVLNLLRVPLAFQQRQGPVQMFCNFQRVRKASTASAQDSFLFFAKERSTYSFFLVSSVSTGDSLTMIGDVSQSLVQGLREAVLPLPPNVTEEWLDDDCLKRFLRADGNDFEKASERLRGTLKWRDEVQPSQLRCAACAEVDPHSHYMQQVLLTQCFAHPRKLFAFTLTSFYYAF
jgi:hypothetical protein